MTSADRIRPRLLSGEMAMSSKTWAAIRLAAVLLAVSVVIIWCWKLVQGDLDQRQHKMDEAAEYLRRGK